MEEACFFFIEAACFSFFREVVQTRHRRGKLSKYVKRCQMSQSLSCSENMSQSEKTTATQGIPASFVCLSINFPCGSFWRVRLKSTSSWYFDFTELSLISSSWPMIHGENASQFIFVFQFIFTFQFIWKLFGFYSFPCSSCYFKKFPCSSSYFKDSLSCYLQLVSIS